MVSKSLQQLDGGLWKLAWRLAAYHKGADDMIRAQERNDQDAPIALAQRRFRLPEKAGSRMSGTWIGLRCFAAAPIFVSLRPICWPVIAAIIVSLMP